jgi:cobalt-zinc-cadmium efflux system protein
MIRRRIQRRRLGGALLITMTFFVVEVAGGLLSGSLALLADAAHMFTDIGALLLSYAAMTLAERAPTTRHSFGLYRAEILAAFVNAQLLLVISGFVFYEAYHRFHQPPDIATGIMLGVAAAGLLANLTSMALLRTPRDQSLNLGAAYLEMLTDAFGSLAVIVTALLIRPTGWYWLDPLVSVAIALLIVPRTLSLLKKSTHILLEGTPAEVDIASLRAELLKIPGVEDVHDLHCWTLTSGLHSASVHVRATPESPRGQVLKEVQKVLCGRPGMDHATIQVEVETQGACEMARGHE